MQILIDPEELRPLIREVVRETLEQVAASRARNTAPQAAFPREPNLFTRREAAEYLKISDRSIDTYIKAGRLKCSRVGRQVRITREELERVAREGVSSCAASS